MANRKITRCRGARGQLALYNPHTVPIEVAQELEGIYGLRPKEAAGCLADVMISQRKGEFPPVAFMLIHKDAPGLLEAEKAFENAFAIAVLPIPRFTELQLLAISNTMQIKIFTAFSLSSGAKLMVSVHEKLASQITEKADQLNKRMNDELLTRKHAMDTLQTNFPFLTVDECDMLLDLFGSIASIAQAGAEKLLDVTVLSTSAAQAIEEFFKSEYVVE
ncbi:hypothetical protein PC129_g5520 [Phytophthora cactorum]|uniref:Uncharacterized protein n=1 Tax=Phytophthora cactorum TaxID=29920 RepID=A0A329S9Z1_9STRA|nr:hypothetical protein Pcac1_g25915 [Phytophthora cactorum]KAG2826315.1 hypothetical protein PC111_g9020 [Phytophthora cactorum]KAG2848684.1 hypothetical protein PC112_g645 [Phytophthora cactorum]KAG2867709.1 hypothetical protein PC113_g1756 [Phytophthora cactorum]KAG2931645.1 hypothetical protein PC114_g2110 [Phytophthora cactorum]